MSAKATGNITSLLYGLYANAAENTLESLDADRLAKQSIFLNDKRWAIARRRDIDETIKQIKKILEKGK